MDHFLSHVLCPQLYDQVQSMEIVLYNSGKVDLEFCVMGVSNCDSKELAPGQISVSPLMVLCVYVCVCNESESTVPCTVGLYL